MKNLKSIVDKFPGANILVIGDLILDEYIAGKVDRISPEAPVPIVWADKRSYAAGGAANVAGNIRSLGAKVCLAGVVGTDKNSEILLSELKKAKISTAAVFSEPRRHTTLKTRVLAAHQQVVRIDWEHTHAISAKLNKKISASVRKNIGAFDAVIIEDYGKGVVNMHLLQEIIGLARSRKKIITVDPKEEHFQYYRGVSSITPNRRELENAVRNLKIKDTTSTFRVNSDRFFTDRDIDFAAAEVMGYLGLESMLVTLGEEGMRIFEKGKRPIHIPTVAQEVFDVSGAGDTVIATFTLGLSVGAAKLEAAHIANFAAGIVVGKLGTAAVTRKELLERIKSA